MEKFLLVSAIVLTLSLLIAIYRLNSVLAKIEVDIGTSFFNDKALPWLNMGGRWLALFGGAATFPLVIGLIFFSETSVKWIVNLGVAGCLAMIGAAILLIPALLGTCITRHIQVKQMLIGILHLTLNKVLELVRQKSFWWWAVGAFLVLLFFPFIEELVSGIVYVIGIITAGRLSLLDNLDEDAENKWSGLVYNYATGKWDHGYDPGGIYFH